MFMKFFTLIWLVQLIFWTVALTLIIKDGVDFPIWIAFICFLASFSLLAIEDYVFK